MIDKRRKAFLLGLFMTATVLCLIGCGDEGSGPSYFPLEAGRSWNYDTGMLKGTMATSRSDHPGWVSFRGSHALGIIDWTLSRDQNAIVVRSKQGEVARLPFPLREGDHWLVPGGLLGPMQVTVGQLEDVKTPAGEFRDCRRLQLMKDKPAIGFVGIGGYEIGLADGVGIVRIAFLRPDGQRATHLLPAVLSAYTRP